MIQVRIRENSWLAKIAARKLGCTYIAMVNGTTIHLYNVSTQHFLKSRSWVLHELKHVDQFQQYGWLRFVWLYFMEYLKNGYYDNRYEQEARQAESDVTLLEKFDLSRYINSAR